jgi:hypothetical protein
VSQNAAASPEWSIGTPGAQHRRGKEQRPVDDGQGVRAGQAGREQIQQNVRPAR